MFDVDVEKKLGPKEAETVEVVPEKKAEEIPPVSFVTLFRYLTPFEFFLDFIGILAAIGAGASQVCIYFPVVTGVNQSTSL